MPKAIVCEITDDFLKCTSADSDRFVYSNYLIPLLVTFSDSKTPILPFYLKSQILDILSSKIVDTSQLAKSLDAAGLGNLFKLNHVHPTTAVAGDTGAVAAIDAVPGLETDVVSSTLKDAGELFTLLAAKVAPQDKSLVLAAGKKLDQARAAAARSGTAFVKGPTMGKGSAELQAAQGKSIPKQQQEIEFFLGLLQSDVGFVFLDRTRIRPAGFVIGEHIYALGLAPGEEIVLEQKTYSKKQLTYEEQNETEKQFDLELSSSLSTEIQEGFERQKNITDSWGLSLSHTGQYSSPQFFWGSFNASHTIGYTKNVTDASQETARRSVRDSQTSSSKVAAKYRTLHKTDFKLSQEQGFEQTSKRLIKNPNRATPITLHYFKVLKKLQLMQERYGVRLCWSPCVKNPAFSFLQEIEDGKQRILDDARTSLPPEPTKPQPQPSGSNETTDSKPYWSDVFNCDKFGLTGDMSADYDLDIFYDSGYTWDNNVEYVKQNLSVISKRTKVKANVVGMPYPTQSEKGNVLRVKVHVGADSWVNGPPISIQDAAMFIKAQPITDTTAQDSQYADALTAYHTDLQNYRDKVDQVMAQVQKDADAFEQLMLQQLNPVTELVKRVIQSQFPPSVRDECWEIDFWQKIFDWERANVATYPSWWSDMIHDPTRDPGDFLNASWARLHLPVRPGMERLALRWIFGKVVGTQLSPEIEKAFDGIEADLKKYRTDTFGSADEAPNLIDDCADIPDKFRCLGKWTDLLPTDGTHIEVIQSYTSAADDFSTSEIEDAGDLRKAVLDSHKQDAVLKEKAADQMTEATHTEVKIKPDRRREEP